MNDEDVYSSRPKIVTQTLQARTRCIEIPVIVFHQTEGEVFFYKRSEPLWRVRLRLLFGAPTYYNVIGVALPAAHVAEPITGSGLCSNLALYLTINLEDRFSTPRTYPST